MMKMKKTSTAMIFLSVCVVVALLVETEAARDGPMRDDEYNHQLFLGWPFGVGPFLFPWLHFPWLTAVPKGRAGHMQAASFQSP